MGRRGCSGVKMLRRPAKYRASTAALPKNAAIAHPLFVNNSHKNGHSGGQNGKTATKTPPKWQILEKGGGRPKICRLRLGPPQTKDCKNGGGGSAKKSNQKRGRKNEPTPQKCLAGHNLAKTGGSEAVVMLREPAGKKWLHERPKMQQTLIFPRL